MANGSVGSCLTTSRWCSVMCVSTRHKQSSCPQRIHSNSATCARIEALGLEGVWQLKPLLDGKALVGALSLPKASECMAAYARMYMVLVCIGKTE